MSTTRSNNHTRDILDDIIEVRTLLFLKQTELEKRVRKEIKARIKNVRPNTSASQVRADLQYGIKISAQFSSHLQDLLEETKDLYFRLKEKNALTGEVKADLEKSVKETKAIITSLTTPGQEDQVKVHSQRLLNHTNRLKTQLSGLTTHKIISYAVAFTGIAIMLAGLVAAKTFIGLGVAIIGGRVAQFGLTEALRKGRAKTSEKMDSIAHKLNNFGTFANTVKPIVNNADNVVDINVRRESRHLLSSSN